MTLEAIIFDVDGTLAETEELHRAAFNEAFADAGLPWHWDVKAYRDLLRVTGGKERLRYFIGSLREGRATTPDEEALIGALHRRKTSHYTDAVDAGGLSLRPGVRELIGAARRDGIRLAIATTTSGPNVESLIGAAFGCRPADLFDAVAAGDCVRVKKPAPDIYHEVLARLRLPADRCVAIEDSEPGVRAATDAGLATIATPSLYSADDDFTRATCLADHLERLAPPCANAIRSTEEIGSGILRALRSLHARASRGMAASPPPGCSSVAP